MRINNDKLFLLYYLSINNQKQGTFDFNNLSEHVGLNKYELINNLFNSISDDFFSCTIAFDAKQFNEKVKNIENDYKGVNPHKSYIDQLNLAKKLFIELKNNNNCVPLNKDNYELIINTTTIQSIRYISEVQFKLNSSKAKEIFNYCISQFNSNKSNRLLSFDKQKIIVLTAIKSILDANQQSDNLLKINIFSILGEHFSKCNYLEIIIALENEGYFRITDLFRSHYEKMHKSTNIEKYKSKGMFSDLDYSKIVFSLEININAFDEIKGNVNCNDFKLPKAEVKIKLYNLRRYSSECLNKRYDQFWNIDFSLGASDVESKERELETLYFLIHCYINECFLPDKRDLYIMEMFNNGDFEYDKYSNNTEYNKEILEYVRKTLDKIISETENKDPYLIPDNFASASDKGNNQQHIAIKDDIILDENIVLTNRSINYKGLLINKNKNGGFENIIPLNPLQIRIINYLFTIRHNPNRSIGITELTKKLGKKNRQSISTRIKEIQDICIEKGIKPIFNSAPDSKWEINPILTCCN